MIEHAEAVVMWAPRGRDGALAAQLIERHGMHAVLIDSVEGLTSRLRTAGCAVLTAEVLTRPVRAVIAKALANQPPWSDFPIVLFGPRELEHGDLALEEASVLGNVTILARPVQSGTLLSALAAALRARRRQYEARDAIHRRDEFLAMLGHELRNPLAAILLAIDSMPATDGQQPGDKQRAIVDRQSRHLARLVDDLLDVARVTSGKVRLRTEALDLGEVVQRCLQGAELAADSRGIELIGERSPEPMPIEGDLVRIEEIFNNLIANALKYSPSGARVTVTTRRDGGRCVAEVSDTGIGIAPEMLDRIFDLFAQVDTTIDRSRGGLGIGLTLVRSLVELHQGEIRVASRGLGYGTTFTVELPASQAAARPGTGPHLSLVAAPSTMRVLLIEDNIDLLELTADLLESVGCEVITATDGAAGLELLVDRAPDLALIDIGLPSMDGYAIAAAARARHVRAFLVAMTGYGQPEDQARAIAAGFDRHLTKPVTQQILRGALADARDATARRDSATRAARRP